jgi:glycosyltransferase involved in cell wall biosynthesis
VTKDWSAATGRPARRPWLSIVTAVYNVERYLPEFINSIDAQRFDLDRIEVIAVNDGSTDASLSVLARWADLSGGRVKVFTKPNEGQASARNLGLEHATGEWVTFADPDDMLDPGFLAAVERFTRRHPDVEVIASKPILYEEETGLIRDTHPRRQQYESGSRRVDLEHDPNTFTGSATVSIFRLDRIRQLGLQFDLRVRPNFEDGHFAAHYLLGLRRPVVGILPGARYVYRKRATGDSTLQLSLADPRRYTDVLEFGYLELLESAKERLGRVPAWLQHVVIYELSWFFASDEKVTTDSPMDEALSIRFHGLLHRILGYLEPEVVRHHTTPPMEAVWADIMAHGGAAEDWHSPVAVRTKVDPAMGLQRIHYRFTGQQPRETFRLRGLVIEPAYGKVMAHSYFRRALLFERIAWLPVGPVEIELGGQQVRVAESWPSLAGANRMSLRNRLWVYRRQPSGFLRARLAYRAKWLAMFLIAPLLRALSRLKPWAPFRGAWVITDRIHDADDNGERLFEYLSERRPDINAWFTIERGTPDWRRLKAAGVRRLVPHGSFRWRMLMLNAAWVISSHADLAIMRPPQIMPLVRKHATWRFAFLQHGIIKDDLSRWLNPRDIEFFSVSTDAELQSIVADGTSYVFTSKETRNTGLARFDRLLAKAAAVPPESRDLVIVAPTWRSWLTLPLAPTSQRREIGDGFWDSDYYRSWLRILTSTEIRAAIDRRRWRLAFMPHPNLQAILSQMNLPAHVEPLSFSGVDVQELYARCALLVTDYSSVAFNVAYIDGPVVYYQFDRDAMFGGAHVGRQGYFDYERDGLGPLATDHDAAVAAIVSSIERGPRPAPEYLDRIARTFVLRDGRCCERVVAAIESLECRHIPRRAPA